MRSVGEIVAARYRVVRPIAEGGMGVLFEAVHISLEERVAIKFVRAADLGANASARFEREARLAVKLRSEHVARVLDAGRDEAGDPFIVMEYLEGVDLGSLVRAGGPLGAQLTADYLVQACHGLAEAHALTIVHRDVKPANLFLTEDAAGLPIVKVLDFGISKAVESGGEELTASPERAAQLLGTPHYVSPEQLLTPHEVDARADIWSLGVCAWSMAIGQLPFAQTDLITLFGHILSGQAPSIAAAQPDLPEAFVRAVDRCLKRERDDRFRDVGELAQALAPFTTARTRPLVEHTVLLLERGRARAGGFFRASTASLSDESEDPTYAEMRPSPSLEVPSARAPALGASATPPDAGVTHTLPVLPLQVLPSYPPPSLPSPPRAGIPVMVGVMVVVLAAIVVLVLGLVLSPRLRHVSTSTPPVSVAPLPAPLTAMPSVAVSPAPSASVTGGATPTASVPSALSRRPRSRSEAREITTAR